jgi:ADP-ribosylglycohydrolase
MSEYLEDPVIDRGLGCLFGAFIGDSLGAYLEFAKEKDYEELMTKGNSI